MIRIYSKIYFGFFFALWVTLATGWSADLGPEVKEGSGSEASGAVIEVIDREYDFGVIRAGDVALVTHTFRFKNIGTEDLVLNKIAPSCGCTSAIASATRIAPGAEGTLTASMKPKGKFGNQTVTVRVETNDPAHSREVFKITGTILSPWRVLPTLLDFREIGRGETSSKIVRVLSQYFEGDSRYRITGLSFSNDAVTAATDDFKSPADPSPSKNYVELSRPIKVKVTAGDQVGQQSAKMFIHTDDPKSATLTVNVRWKVEGDLAVSARRIIVRKYGGRVIETPLTLSSRSGQEFEILSVEVKERSGAEDIINIEAMADSTPTKKIYKVTVTDTAPAGRPFVGEVIFTTNHPEKTIVKVPFTATVVEARGRKVEARTEIEKK